MQGMSDIMALYAEGASSLCVNGSVDMLGRLAGISASKYTGYPPYDDAPKEGEFDWEGFTRNLAIGLGVVAVCAIGAAISIATLGAGSILAGAFIGAGIGALSTTAMKAGEEISTGNVRSAKEAFRDVGISAARGFITGAFGAKFPGAHRLVEGVVDTTVSAGERLAYAVFDDSMSWDEKWAYAFDPGQMVADFVTGVVIGEILDGIMAATQNKLRSIFANYDVTMREALETSYGKSTLNSLKNTENFTDSAIEHIFEGQVNARGKAVGYHYEGIEGTSGNVIPGTESSVNNIGIYKAKVEVNGVPKTANGGFSSFYPKSMSPQEVIGSINEAYRNRVYIRGNTYSGLTSSGMEIEMFLDKNGKIISAYPVY